MMRRLLIIVMALCGGCDVLHGMNADDLGHNSPSKDVLRRGGGYRSPRSPRSPRKRASAIIVQGDISPKKDGISKEDGGLKINYAKENNSGYFVVEVALHAPFTDGVAKIQEATKLKGNTIDHMEHWLTLFTFNVPITDDLLKIIKSKALRIKNTASQLTDEDRKIIATRIKEATETIVNTVRENACFTFDLDEVVAEDGTVGAYFLPSGDFASSLNQMRTLLEYQYRWGADNQDGIWFDFEDANSVRPHMKILTRTAGKKMRDAFSSGVNLLSRSSKKMSLDSSRNSLDLSTSVGDDSPAVTARQRRNNQPPKSITPPRSPARSPEVSPRTSREGSPRKSFGQDYWKDTCIRTIEVTGNDLRVEVKAVQTRSGNCEKSN